MNKKSLQFVGIIFFIILFFGCEKSIEQFSPDTPFAIELKRVRSFYHAKTIETRLKEMEVPVYMISLKDEKDDNNEWYVLVTGAEKDTVGISQLKTKLEIELKLKNVKVLNYNRIVDNLTEIQDKKITEVEKINAEKPDIPEEVYELVEKFPENNLFNIKNVSLHNFPDANIPSRYLRSYYDAKLDLPRGVKRSIIAKNASSFAEVIYEDNLYEDQVTIEILKLRKGHELDKQPRARLIQNSDDNELTPYNIAWYFATLVLNTGNYMTEEYEKIQVESFMDLYGYKVVIEPKKDYLRTYMILVDEKNEYVIFSQSTDKTDEEILGYLEDFGKSQGMLTYNEFHNSFFTIPKCLEEGDVFLGYSSSILGNSYARSKRYAKWAKAMVGHSESSAHFYNTKLKKAWSCSSFDLITNDKKDYIYGDMYSNANTSGKYPIKVSDRDGYFVGIPRVGYNEVNFSTDGRHVMAVGGLGMSKNHLLKRAIKFQSGEVSVEEDPCEPKEKHFINFYANDIDIMVSDGRTFTGHAFVGFARESHEEQMTVWDGDWGFYPSSEGGGFKAFLNVIGGIIFEVPGEIRSDFLTQKDISLFIEISEEDYYNALSIKNNWSNDMGYELLQDDCVSFVESVANSINGLITPNRITNPTPQGYVKKLIEINNNYNLTGA